MYAIVALLVWSALSVTGHMMAGFVAAVLIGLALPVASGLARR